jgi:hypothetical protein
MSSEKKDKEQQVPIAISLEQKEVEVMTGSRNPDAMTSRVKQLEKALWMPPNASAADQVSIVRGALATLQGIAPADDLEGMLAVQMVAVNQAAVQCMQQAASPRASEAVRDTSIHRATRLMNLYTRQFEVFDRRRGRGNQKVAVEQVNVHAGGQAIVGNVGMQERPAPASAERPALSYQESTAMPMLATDLEPVATGRADEQE